VSYIEQQLLPVLCQYLAMTPAEKRDDFLTKAADDDAHALATIDSVQRAGWESIAAGYRSLAAHVGLHHN
jgi:hypothetical protein